MNDEPDNIILKHLRELRADTTAIKADLGKLNDRMGHLASAMVTLRQDMRELNGIVQPLAIASTHYDQRLARIEGRLGVDNPTDDPLPGA